MTKRIVAVSIGCVALILVLAVIESQIMTLSTSIKKVVDVSDSTPKPFVARRYDVYEVVGKALVRTKPDGTKQAVVEDLSQAGVNIEICSRFEEDVFVLEQPEANDYVFLVEGCGEMGGTMWSFHIPTGVIKKLKNNYTFGASGSSPRGDYQVLLGKEDPDGEVRTLRVVDFKADDAWNTASLPPALTYESGTSEFDGSPYGDVQWTNVDFVRAKVYLTDVPYGLFDNREPVLNQYVPLYKGY